MKDDDRVFFEIVNDIETGGGSKLFKLRYASILQEMRLTHIADQAL